MNRKEEWALKLLMILQYLELSCLGNCISDTRGAVSSIDVFQFNDLGLSFVRLNIDSSG